ncbi:IS1/IS1595 family N-terminal zinc-binding domain-containing protein [Persephonella sp.]
MGGKKVRCPHCESERCVKNGKANGKQTYLCKDCYYRFTINATKRKYPFKIRREAVNLYKEGYTLTEISKKLNIKVQTIHHWVKKYKDLRGTKKV